MARDMLTLTGEYALRAMIYLTEHTEAWPIPGWEIAEQAGIPARYLSKVLGDLVRCGVLQSSPGKGGGFRMTQPPEKTALYDVLAPFGQFGSDRMPFINEECPDALARGTRLRWREVMESETAFLKKTTVADIAACDRRRAKAKRARRKRN